MSEYDEERARAKRELRREERRIIDDHELRAQFELRLAALELGLRAQQDSLVEAMKAVTDTFERIGDQPRVALSGEQLDQLKELQVHVAQLAAKCAQLYESRAEFRFAREHGELPFPKLDS